MLRAGAVGVAATAGMAATGRAAEAGGGSAGGAPGQTSPDDGLILHNGKIHTMDAAGTVTGSVAIRGGRIAGVGGGPETLRRAFTGRPKVINLRGRTVIPGIIDCHNHIVLMGNRPGHHTPLENAYSVGDVQRIYAGRAEGVPEGEFITTIGGFHFNQFAEVRLPRLAELDEAVPDHPAYISVGFSGPSVVNGKGKAFLERLADPVEVGEDGAIAAGSETGKATLALRRMLTADRRKQGVLDAMAYATSVGVTTHLDQGAFQATGTPSDGAASEDNYTMHLPFLAIHDEGRATIRLRINFLHMETDPQLPELTQRLRNAFKFFGDDMVRTGGIGEFLAAGLGPTWLDAARKVAAARWRAEVHSLTATDFQTEIQGFETVNSETPITDLRWVIAHVPFITEDYLDRLKALGGGVNLTGWRYLTGTSGNAGPPFRLIVDNGIHAGMSSDGMQIAPMNPFIHAYYAVTGKNALGETINDGQQITREELLALYTRANGWFLGHHDEDQLGTIEPGRLGDLVVLSHDYFSIPEDRLRQVRAVLTVVGGRIVHDTGELTRP
jgi:predicted amidohydrolase YtcJ